METSNSRASDSMPTLTIVASSSPSIPPVTMTKMSFSSAESMRSLDCAVCIDSSGVY